MIVQDDMVAVQHYTSNGWNVSVDGTVYIFTPRRNVSMAWVRREHLEKILSIDAQYYKDTYIHANRDYFQ